jgi:regulator of protease activity HflC (stomatin/prohibitin superfamily)
MIVFFEAIAGVLVAALLVRAARVLLPARALTVHEYEVGLLYRRGHFVRVLRPGVYRAGLLRREIVVLDARRRFAAVPGQEVLSQDGVGLKVSVAVSFELADPVAAVHRAADREQALHVIVQLALRAAVGALRIDDLLAQREELGRRLRDAVAPQAAELGLRIHAVEVKDVMLPGELKRVFAEVARAQKEGQAALERARGETAALRSLANAARLVQESPGLMGLRTLQTIAEAASRGGTVVMGVPAGLVSVRAGAARRDEE